MNRNQIGIAMEKKKGGTKQTKDDITSFWADAWLGTVKCDTCNKDVSFIGTKSTGERAFEICDHKDSSKPK